MTVDREESNQSFIVKEGFSGECLGNDERKISERGTPAVTVHSHIQIYNATANWSSGINM